MKTPKRAPFKRWLFRIFRKNETAIRELNYLFWECTWRCNLSCRHCGSDCQSEAHVPDMPFIDFLRALKPLEKRYPRDTVIIAITGGEPLLRKDLAACGKTLREHGFRWGIVTNGMLYDEARHRELVAAGLSSVTVSLDGLEETHNWLRGHPESYRRAMNALRLIAHTRGLNYDVVTCVHQRNIGELTQLKEELLANGIHNWRLFTIAPIGRASSNDTLQLTRPQLEEMLQFIAETRQEGRINITFSCEAYTGKYEEGTRDSYFFCRAGINIGSVLIDGSISACPNINRSFVQGNIYQDDLMEVWDNKFQVMRDREWMRCGPCAKCKDFKQCLGGAMHLHPTAGQPVLRCYKFS
ncbi:MAG: TIGR04133 family radical SAM/SPASM protein [Bacteroidales bacterium]|nr:TIGR04133 family radical SAM/SPASM protein [Bacteroidales bacterium]